MTTVSAVTPQPLTTPVRAQFDLTRLAPTRGELHKLAPTLDANQFDIALRSVLHVSPNAAEHETVGWDLALGLLIYSWLHHLGLFNEYQIRTLVWRLLPVLEERLPHLGRRDVLLLVDGRYASWYGRDNWMDLRYDTDVAELPCLAITHVVCQFQGLMDQALRRLKQLRGVQRHVGNLNPSRAELGDGIAVGPSAPGRPGAAGVG